MLNLADIEQKGNIITERGQGHLGARRKDKKQRPRRQADLTTPDVLCSGARLEDRRSGRVNEGILGYP